MTVQLAECRHGRFLILDNDQYIGRLLARDGTYSEGEVDLFASLVRPGDVVVEAGANIGAHTIPLSRMAGAEGRVLAFEPQQAIYRLLCGNLALNACHNVDAYPVGLGSINAELHLPIIDYEGSLLNFGGVSLRPEWPGDKVAVFQLDRLELKELRLLKADVEGMEIDVLLGAQNTIRRCRPYLYIEDDENNPEPRRKVLSDLGYGVKEHRVPLLGPDDPFNPYPGYTIVSKNIFATPNNS